MSFHYKWSAVRPRGLNALFAPKLLTVAVGLALSANSLAGFPTVYGKIHLTANQYDLEKNDFPVTTTHLNATNSTTELDTFALESTGSRLGIQGDFDANADVTLFYRVEYGIDVDNGTNSNGRELSQRNIFAGLRGTWGSVLAGKNDTPLKTLQTNTVLRSDIDRFNDSPLADLGTYFVGENRVDNVIQYTSPVLLGGLEVNVAAIQAEQTGVAVNENNPQDENDFASGQSVSVTYGKATWFVGAAFESNVVATDTVRALGEITLGSVKLGALYQTAEAHEDEGFLGPFSTFVGTNGTSVGAQNGLNPASEWDGNSTASNAFSEQDGYLVNAQWKIAGPWLAKIQYAKSTTTPAATTPTDSTYADVELDGIALGLDYNFKAGTRVFAYLANVEAQGDKRINTQSITDSTAAVGLDFRF